MHADHLNAIILNFNITPSRQVQVQCIFVYSFLSAELFKFTCPKVDDSVGATHPRYADPEDCQYFYVCINGEQPRRNGCKLGQAFDDVTKRCDWARKIPEW